LGERVFYGCQSLREINFDRNSKLSNIGAQSFFASGLETVRIPASVETIGPQSFAHCNKLIDLSFDPISKLRAINDGGFEYCGCKSIEIPAKVEKIHRRCFYECSELSEVIFQGVTEIEEEAFAECPLTVVRLTPGLHLDYTFPPGCRIEYVRARVETPGRDSQNWSASPERFSAISEWTIPLDSDYEEFRRVGSAVKLYRHLRTGEEIAVKSLPAPSRRVEIAEVQNRFVREFEVLISLSHPCVLDIKGCCPPGPRVGPKIITDWLTGGSLHPILAYPDSPPIWWSPTQKAKTIAGMVMGMIYLHSRGFIHRGLKPENVLLDDNHNVKIADFWCSRFEDIDGSHSIFMAPEVAEGNYGPKVDVYSFGLILYEIVVGSNVLSGNGQRSPIVNALIKGHRPPIKRSVLPGTKLIIEKCWMARAEDRPGFNEIWSFLTNLKFQVVRDVSPADVQGYVRWVEGQVPRQMRPVRRGR
jgi:hypothetical protein